jgi:hypothetical protein
MNPAGWQDCQIYKTVVAQHHITSVDQHRLPLPLLPLLPLLLLLLPWHTDVTVELEDIVDAVNVSRTIKNPWGTILRRRYRPQLVISILIPIFQQVCQ